MITRKKLLLMSSLLILAELLCRASGAADLRVIPGQTKGGIVEIVLVDAKSVTPASVSEWKKDRFQAVAVILDDQTDKAACRDVARYIFEGGLNLYWWIEVARNPKLATTHPRWMAALGSHMDWQKRFPNSPEPGIGQVAKAFPWVPIGYSESFDGHLARIEQLLQRVPDGWQGLLLNDLQAGPSSCGCGNLQCRWSLDYFVPATATKLAGDDVAAKFVNEVRKRTGGKSVIPVWTTECAEVDLPPEKHGGLPSTGFCGNVGCAHSACAEKFSAQWSALTSINEGPTALLATHTTLNRTQPEFGGGPMWFANAIDYVNRTLPANGGKTITPERLWIVADGMQPGDESKVREAAAKAGVGGLISAHVKIDQSYEPKIIRAN